LSKHHERKHAPKTTPQPSDGAYRVVWKDGVPQKVAVDQEPVPPKQTAPPKADTQDPTDLPTQTTDEQQIAPTSQPVATTPSPTSAPVSSDPQDTPIQSPAHIAFLEALDQIGASPDTVALAHRVAAEWQDPGDGADDPTAISVPQDTAQAASSNAADPTAQPATHEPSDEVDINLPDSDATATATSTPEPHHLTPPPTTPTDQTTKPSVTTTAETTEPEANNTPTNELPTGSGATEVAAHSFDQAYQNALQQFSPQKIAQAVAFDMSVNRATSEMAKAPHIVLSHPGELADCSICQPLRTDSTDEVNHEALRAALGSGLQVRIEAPLRAAIDVALTENTQYYSALTAASTGIDPNELGITSPDYSKETPEQRRGADRDAFDVAVNALTDQIHTLTNHPGSSQQCASCQAAINQEIAYEALRSALGAGLQSAIEAPLRTLLNEVQSENALYYTTLDQMMAISRVARSIGDIAPQATSTDPAPTDSAPSSLAGTSVATAPSYQRTRYAPSDGWDVPMTVHDEEA
jgi:hypothetical protein